MVSFKRSITKPLVLEHHFLFKTTGGVINNWNETTSKIHKVVSCKRNITKPMALERPCLYTHKSPGVIRKVWNETISNIPKVVSFQRNITTPMLSATRFSIQPKIHRFSNQSLKWNQEQVASFQRNIRKPMLFLKFLLYGQHLSGFLRAVWNETTIGWFHFKKTIWNLFCFAHFQTQLQKHCLFDERKGRPYTLEFRV